MIYLYLDESGDCSFSEKSQANHFVITVLSIDGTEIKNLRNRMKSRFAAIIRKGWPKGQEVKASKLNRYNENGVSGPDEVDSMLNAIVGVPGVKIGYFVVNKSRIQNEAFKSADYGISYNFFTKKILLPLIFENNYTNICFTYDRRNKETHHNRHFKDYLRTEILGKAIELNTNVKLELHANDSDKVHGLMAVDFLSWSIYRKYEFNKDRFFKLIEKSFVKEVKWYV